MIRMRVMLLLASVILGMVTAAARPGPADEAGDEAALVRGNTRFALELYERLRAEEGNLFVSPFSISTALAMTHAGARGETAAEMARVLHFELPNQQLHPAFAALLAGLDVKEKEPGYRLHIANALWAQQDYRFLPEFLALGREQYRAGLETLDFVENVEAARQRINAWVAQRTAGKIRELIQPGILGRTTRLVLTNAIYFKGDWAAQFDEQATRAAPFTLADGRQVSARLMQQIGEFGYLEQPTFQLLELPYAGDALSMVVLLPAQRDGLPALEKSLEAQLLATWLNDLDKRKVSVALPRFTMKSRFRLDKTLRAMGMPTPFDPKRADFSGMDGTRLLYIGAVLHEAFVDVNEEGTEAAGATAVVQKMAVAVEPTPTFRADHPFLFLIRDVRTGTVLFLGRVADPTR